MTTVYALHVFVERLQGSVARERCCSPVVSFRLLDYPVVEVNAEARGERRDDNAADVVEIRRGKSCLFDESDDYIRDTVRHSSLWFCVSSSVDGCSATGVTPLPLTDVAARSVVELRTVQGLPVGSLVVVLRLHPRETATCCDTPIPAPAPPPPAPHPPPARIPRYPPNYSTVSHPMCFTTRPPLSSELRMDPLPVVVSKGWDDPTDRYIPAVEIASPSSVVVSKAIDLSDDDGAKPICPSSERPGLSFSVLDRLIDEIRFLITGEWRDQQKEGVTFIPPRCRFTARDEASSTRLPINGSKKEELRTRRVPPVKPVPRDRVQTGPSRPRGSRAVSSGGGRGRGGRHDRSEARLEALVDELRLLRVQKEADVRRVQEEADAARRSRLHLKEQVFRRKEKGRKGVGSEGTQRRKEPPRSEFKEVEATRLHSEGSEGKEHPIHSEGKEAEATRLHSEGLEGKEAEATRLHSKGSEEKEHPIQSEGKEAEATRLHSEGLEGKEAEATRIHSKGSEEKEHPIQSEGKEHTEVWAHKEVPTTIIEEMIEEDIPSGYEDDFEEEEETQEEGDRTILRSLTREAAERRWLTQRDTLV